MRSCVGWLFVIDLREKAANEVISTQDSTAMLLCEAALELVLDALS